MKVLTIGGSRNIGYYSSIRLLAAGATVTFLLRSPSAFEKDDVIQEYVKTGTARLVQGDALVADDVKRAWDEAAKGDGGGVDVFLFTLGYTGPPKFHPLKGFVLTPANLCTQALLTALCTMPAGPPPKLIMLSSTGVTRAAHATLPLLYKPLYSYLLGEPLKDKRGAERAIAHCAGWAWEDGEPGADIMGAGDWTAREGLPAPGALKGSAVIVRAAMLTDGACRAEGQKGKDAYRAAASLAKPYTVSRRDVAHFVVEDLLKRWDEFDRVVEIAY